MINFKVGSTPATRTKMNDPTQFEQVDETCEFGGAVLYSESLGITAFFENVVPSKYETQKTQTASIWHRKRKNQAVRTRMSHSAFSMEFSSTWQGVRFFSVR